MTKTPYTDRFFARQRDRSRESASIVLPAILGAARPRSVVDVGCGVGTWLATTGVDDVIGLDGAWVDPASLEIDPSCFRAVDLDRPLSLDRTFDLAICMETAEHLRPERSQGLVADLVRLAPVVLFSAAIPGQQGTRHINERWPDFWAGLFAAHGYRCLDAIRWTHWDDPRVEYWYAQNAFLYIREGHPSLELPARGEIPFRVVHPDNLARRLNPRYIRAELALRALAFRAGGALWRSVRRLEPAWQGLRSRR
jgi:SAM-dependent methyltransferase